MYQMTTEKMTPAEKASRRLVMLLCALLATLCFSEVAMPEELDLPREQIALVAPPFRSSQRTGDQSGPQDRGVLAHSRGEADGYRHRDLRT
jgi:hypothetical protein